MRSLLPTLTLLAAIAAAAPAGAHAVWLEDDGDGAVRVLLGEPAQPQPPGGDPEFPKLKAPLVFTGETRAAAPLERKADHIRATVREGADVRATDAAIFEPWKVGDGYEAAAFYARLGRSEPRALLDLELAPVAADADTFQVLFKGKPLAGAAVTVIDPEQWTKSVKADAGGRFRAPVSRRGRYVLEVSHAEAGSFSIGGRAVRKLHHVATLTFENP